MNLECTAGISKIAIKAVEEDGIVARIVRMTLAREFDSIIASAIGGDAYTLLDALREHSASKVEIPIDAVSGECRLEGEQGDAVTIKLVKGVKAIGKAPGKEESEPTVELVFDFPFQIEAWAFFGRNVSARVALVFTKTQLELPGTAPAAHAAGAKEKTGGPAVVEALDRLKASVPDGTKLSILAGGKSVVVVDKRSAAEIAADTEEQAAETPEEAEALRAERLARERAESEPTPSAFVAARYAAIEGEILVSAPAADLGDFLARYETPVSIIEALGETEEAAREALRVKLFAKFAEDEAKLAGLSAPPKIGLVVPHKTGANGKGKTNGHAKPAAPPPVPAPVDEDLGAPPEFPTCEPGCTDAHVHAFAPGEDGIRF